MVKVMKHVFIYLSIPLFFVFNHTIAHADNCSARDGIENQNKILIKSTLNNMYGTWKSGKNTSDFDKIFDKEFIFYGNGSKEDYDKFKSHMSNNINYWEYTHVKILDIFPFHNKVTARIYVEGKSKLGKLYKLDSIEIFEIRNKRIINWWENSYPDWRQMVKESGEKY